MPVLSYADATGDGSPIEIDLQQMTDDGRPLGSERAYALAVLRRRIPVGYAWDGRWN